MHKKNSIKTSFVITILLLTTVGLLLPSTSATVNYDDGDGFWTDDFVYDSIEDIRVICNNCTVDTENGTILLNETAHVGRIYDFDEGGCHKEGGSHKAYSYKAYFFLPVLIFNPISHILLEDEFDPDFEYPNIEDNTTNGDERYVETSSAGFKRYVVHHFRFKLDVDAESVGGLNVYWSGKADDDTNIKLYYWAFFGESKRIGFWSPLGVTQSDGSDVELTESISADDASLALNEDNYIDICVVCSPSSSSCTLYTDYVGIISESEIGYITDPASVVMKDTIAPNDPDFYWGTLIWDDYERSESTVKYHVLYDKDSSGNFSDLVEDTHFSDGSNSEGFTHSPVSLTDIPYDEIKLKAILTTDSPSVTPKIFNWGVTWQNDPNKWQDLFNSTFRIDTRARIKFENDNISINPVSGDWSMFGQNPQNTRVSEGKGANTSSLYWWSKSHEANAEELFNPVISDEYFYICAKNSGNGKLYRYKIVPSTPSFEPGDKYPGGPYEFDMYYDNDLVGSPAISDQFIVLATGEIDNKGTENYVYAIDKYENHSLKWEFPYDDDICYWASPIITDDKVFIASWSGDPDPLQSNENNKVIALDLSNGNNLWEFDLPAHGFSTPAVYNDMVIVGCKERTDNSLFALDIESGAEIWNVSVGSIGRASPVIYNDKVFIVSEEKGIASSRTKLTALDATNGSIIWEKFITRRIAYKIDLSSPHISATLADSTPAVHDGVIYVASPLGNIMALDTTNGTELWSEKYYQKPLLSNEDTMLPIFSNEILTASPAYADGLLYIGTPQGYIYALNVEDGSEKWSRKTYRSDADIPIVTSPIVSNGLVYVGAGLKKNSDGEMITGSGRLYCIGSYQEPNEEIDGYFTSVPISIPTSYWWKKFYTSFNASDIGNNIEFSILDENKNLISIVENDKAINFGNKSLTRTIRLRADLSAENLSVNPILYDWSITFESDPNLPIINLDTLSPSQDGWVTEAVYPEFEVEVRDNMTGLDVSTAKFEIEYTTENGSGTETYNANCTGEDGTTSWETITADISALEYYENITRLNSIEISISDLAGNENSTGKIVLKQDTQKPESSVDNETNGKEFSSDIVKINVTADDPGIQDVNSSGIASVRLVYRYSSSKVPNFSGDWIDFEDPITSAPFTWNFTTVEGGGHYELATIAIDNIGNEEDEPVSANVSFIFDNEPPNKPSGLSGTHWFKELPTLSIEFSDDFLLDTIKYRPEFETEWIEIDSDINQATYDSEWELDPDHWDQMEDGVEYLLYFLIDDSLGNTRIIEDAGYKITKDAAKPNVDLEIPTLETEWSFEDTLKISAFATDGEGSGIESVELFYQYSEDGNFDGNWTSYGLLISEPFEWEFEAAEGNGYYEFKVVAEDLAGNVAESEVFSTGVNIFPLFSVVAMIILIIVLILVTIVIYIKWRKK